MKLGLFHPAFRTLGGAEVLAASHGRFLAEAGHQVGLVTFGYDPDRWASQLQGIEVRNLPKRDWSEAFNFWDRVRKQRARGRRAEPALQDFDTVIAYNWPCSSMLGRAQVPGRKIWHCNEPPRGLHAREANPFLSARAAAQPTGGCEALVHFRRVLKDCDAKMASRAARYWLRQEDLEAAPGLDGIWALSEFTRANFRAIYGPREVEVIYPLVRFPEGACKQRGLDRSGLKVLVHSRLEVLKNIDTVLRGFRAFQEKACPSAQLHVVGQGEERPALEALGKELGLGDAITFHGFLPDEELRKVYEACDVFALLTLDEPFGMVYPEAAAKGLLLIGPDHGGPFEILEGGRWGWCVDPFDPAALAEALARVWALPDEEVCRRRTDAEAACRARFGREAVGARLLELLKA